MSKVSTHTHTNACQEVSLPCKILKMVYISVSTHLTRNSKRKIMLYQKIQCLIGINKPIT